MYQSPLIFDAYGTLFDVASLTDACAAAVSGAGLAERFQAVLSVDAVRTYKPDPPDLTISDLSALT